MLPEVLKALRNEKNISQASLADQLGLSQQAIAKWETGKSEPDTDLLNRLALFYNVSVDYLLGRTAERRPNEMEDLPDTIKILLRSAKKLTPEQLNVIQQLVNQFVNEKPSK
mgnify:CR=1 FL=1